MQKAEARIAPLEHQARRMEAAIERLVRDRRQARAQLAALTAWRSQARSAQSDAAREVCQQAKKWQSLARARLQAVESSVGRIRATSLQRRCWACWAAQRQDAAQSRENRRLGAERLSVQNARHTQLSWLCACQMSQKLEYGARDLLTRWRYYAKSEALASIQKRLSSSNEFSWAMQCVLDRLSARTGRQALLRDLVFAWHSHVHQAHLSLNLRQATDALTARLVRTQQRVGTLQSSLHAASEDFLKRMGWLALWTNVREHAHQSRQRQACTEQMRELTGRLGRRTQSVVDRLLLASLHPVISFAWALWSAAVATGKLSRSATTSESRATAARASRAASLLQAVSWVWCKAMLCLALSAWLEWHDGCREVRRRDMAEARAHGRWAVLLDYVTARFGVVSTLHACRCVWQAWRKAWAAGKHSKAECDFRHNDARRVQQLERVRVLLVNSSVRAFLGLRVCFASWRQLRSLQDLLSTDKEHRSLRHSHQRLKQRLSSQLENLGVQLSTTRACATARIAFAEWRRHRHLAGLLRDLGSLQQLLIVLHAEGQVHLQSYQAAEAMSLWLEQQRSSARGRPACSS